MALKEEELYRYQQQLLALKKKIIENVCDLKEDIQLQNPSKGYSQHQADEGSDDFDQIINLQLSDKELVILEQIDKALGRIKDKSYGICEVSGKPIPKKRLDAVPYATTTVEAQAQLERRKST